MVTCTKYYCSNCAKEVKEYSDLENTWYGNNPLKYAGGFRIINWNLTEPEQIEPFPRLEIGDLCKLCFEDCKSRVKAWTANNNLKEAVKEC